MEPVALEAIKSTIQSCSSYRITRARVRRAVLTASGLALLAASGCALAAPAAYVATSEIVARNFRKDGSGAAQAHPTPVGIVPQTASASAPPAAPPPIDDRALAPTPAPAPNDKEPSARTEKPSVENRLQELQRIKEQGLITQEQYNQKQAAILNDL